jgi:hypothetical protein
MMARVARLAGAILAETAGEFFVIGDLKEPCDFAAAGFEPPKEVDFVKRPYIKLAAKHQVAVTGTYLIVDCEGEALVRMLAERLVIERNGSVSERLWRLITDPSGREEVPDGPLNARWFGEMPAEIWQIVRDTVLRCL